MANPNFTPNYSTDEIYRGNDMDRCLSDDLEALETGKAAAEHTHSGYAAADHAHSGYAAVNHSHDGYAAMEHTHTGYAQATHEHSGYAAASHEHTGYAASSHAHSYNDLSDKPTIPSVPASLPANGGNADTVGSKQASEFAEADHTHTGFASSSHTHELSAITGLMDMLLTDTAGKQKTTITGNVLTTIAGLPAGVHTAYSAGGTGATASAAPNAVESWRYLIHKNYANYGWVMAFGSEGSFFINYYDGGTWRGWKPIWDNNPAPLWSGAVFMNANQTITPSKKLSECKNGWVLLWSDYDTVNGGATNGDVFASYVPKRCYTGGNWSGHSWLVDIPAEASASAENRCIKKVYMWNDRIVGNAINEASPRNDVVLRAVYEF